MEASSTDPNKPPPAQKYSILRWIIFIPLGWAAIYIVRVLSYIFLAWAFPSDVRPWEVGLNIMFLLPFALPILVGLAYFAGTIPAIVAPRKSVAVPIFGTLLVVDTLFALEQIWIEGRLTPITLTFALLLTSIPAFMGLAISFNDRRT